LKSIAGFIKMIFHHIWESNSDLRCGGAQSYPWNRQNFSILHSAFRILRSLFYTRPSSIVNSQSWLLNL
jgi:hypothetical protein